MRPFFPDGTTCRIGRKILLSQKPFYANHTFRFQSYFANNTSCFRRINCNRNCMKENKRDGSIYLNKRYKKKKKKKKRMTEINPRSVVAKVLDCDIVVNEFELQSRYYVLFWKKYPWERYELRYCVYELYTIIIAFLQECVWY